MLGAQRIMCVFTLVNLSDGCSGTRLLAVFNIFGFYSGFQLRVVKPKPKQLLTSYTTQSISNCNKTKTCTHLTQRLFLTNV